MYSNKRYSKNEFRFNRKTKHMNYIFEEDSKNYRGVGLTHNPWTRDRYKKYHKNMPLEVNPQKNKFEKSYVRYGYITQSKRQFGQPDNRFEFSQKDKGNVKAKIRHFKNRKY